jgi:hypothetical protein
MQQPDYAAFFDNYVDVFNQSLGNAPDVDAIRADYAEYVVSAGAGGVVAGGENDDKYADVLRKGAKFYRQVGLQGMTLIKVEVTPLDPEHDMARPFFRADYRRKDDTAVSIEFDVLYMLQRREGGPKIFCFVAGDEMALYRRYGLVDEAGQPA